MPAPKKEHSLRRDWFSVKRFISVFKVQYASVYIGIFPIISVLIEIAQFYSQTLTDFPAYIPITFILSFFSATFFVFARIIYRTYCPEEIQKAHDIGQIIHYIQDKVSAINDTIDNYRKVDDGISDIKYEGLLHDIEIQASQIPDKKGEIVDHFKRRFSELQKLELVEQLEKLREGININNMLCSFPLAQKACYWFMILSALFSVINFFLLCIWVIQQAKISIFVNF